MGTHLYSRHVSRLLASWPVVMSLAAVTAGAALGANPNQSFVATACATTDGRLEFGGTWSGVRVAAWSNFIESTEGSGGTFEPLPEPARSGSVSGSTGQTDVSTIQSVTVTLHRTTAANGPVAATETVNQPLGGWPSC
jgi:hypothetical protein